MSRIFLDGYGPTLWEKLGVSSLPWEVYYNWKDLLYILYLWVNLCERVSIYCLIIIFV